MATENGTVIGKSVRIVGHVVGSDDLVIDGELEGTAQVPGARLTIGPAARVRADIVAKDVIVLGKLEGDIRATGRVELRSSAMMQGSVFASTLSIEDNAAFRGQVDPTRANEPLPERAIPSTGLSGISPGSSAPAVDASAAGGAVVVPGARPADAAGTRSTSQMPAALAAVAGRPPAAAPGSGERKIASVPTDKKS